MLQVLTNIQRHRRPVAPKGPPTKAIEIIESDCFTKALRGDTSGLKPLLLVKTSAAIQPLYVATIIQEYFPRHIALANKLRLATGVDLASAGEVAQLETP